MAEKLQAVAPTLVEDLAGEDGFTEEQFATALKKASQTIAEKAEAAKCRGFVGAEETKKLMDAALNADA